MDGTGAYSDFTTRLKLLIGKRPDLITTTLSNIFTMRLIGNKTHGDLAEIAVSEFINQYMYDFRSVHVGKDRYRKKTQEEDILITNEITKAEFPVSLKAYGYGDLQLSTDKNHLMYTRLKNEGKKIVGKKVKKILDEKVFSGFNNILSLIYDEKNKRCNILVFDYARARSSTVKIIREEPGRRRKHPVYRFYDADSRYICEVRYGGTDANALQRGLWTNTRNGIEYFESITNGWICYSHNHTLVKLFSHALVASDTGHTAALPKISEDIAQLKRGLGPRPRRRRRRRKRSRPLRQCRSGRWLR